MKTFSHETHTAIDILIKYIPTQSREAAVSESKKYLLEWRMQRDELRRKIAASASK
jgi:hypothetical protein